MSRFTLLDIPVAYPGKCAVCGAINRPVVDFGANVEYDYGRVGALYQCVDCLTEAAKVIGMVSRDQHNALDVRYKLATMNVDSAVAVLEGAKSEITKYVDMAVANVGACLSGSFDPVVSNDNEVHHQESFEFTTDEPESSKSVDTSNEFIINEGSISVPGSDFKF